MLRAVARAEDWVEKKCPPVLLEEGLLPLALLRLAIKFECLRQHVVDAVKILQPLAGEKRALLSFECRLVMALWGAGGGLDHCLESPATIANMFPYVPSMMAD